MLVKVSIAAAVAVVEPRPGDARGHGPRRQSTSRWLESPIVPSRSNAAPAARGVSLPLLALEGVALRRRSVCRRTIEPCHYLDE